MANSIQGLSNLCLGNLSINFSKWSIKVKQSASDPAKPQIIPGLISLIFLASCFIKTLP